MKKDDVIVYFSYSIDGDLLDSRVDIIVTKITDLSRNYVQKLIRDSLVLVSGDPIVSPSTKIKHPTKITIITLPPEDTDIKPADISLDIIYEDEDLIVINKPAGLVVHPGVSHHNDTLVNALLYHKKDELSSIGGIVRPGIVHRLDKDTSGLLLIAKNDNAHISLSNQIAQRQCKRIYTALIWGVPKGGTIKTLIAKSRIDHFKMSIVRHNGKIAITHYQVLESIADNKLSLVSCQLDTGRTHQIRLHMSYIGHSIFGDQTYGNNKRKILNNFHQPEIQEKLLQFARQWLHASYISFIHPTHNNLMEFSCPIPQELEDILNTLNNYLI